ncbi:hypothetical protein NECID01_1890 [Nematocida sp. AWRm77]|nr:hypothetical protein NECID01_1890 [Nematocida sp. AWRm77]
MRGRFNAACFLVFFGICEGCASIAVWLECFGTPKRYNVLVHGSMSSLCVFFLYTKGILAKQITEQKLAFSVVVYRAFSFLYLYMCSSISFKALYWLLWIHACVCLGTYVCIAHSEKALSWRVHNRLFSSKVDLFFYHIKIFSDTYLFVLHFFLAAYLLSSNPLYRKIPSAILLCSLCARLDSLYILWGSILVSLAAFFEVLFFQNILSISVFVFGVSSAFLLGIDTHFRWHVEFSAAKRLSLE